MKTFAPNSGKEWTSQEVATLRSLAKGNTPTPTIASYLGRTIDAVQSEASKKKISLKPRDRK